MAREQTVRTLKMSLDEAGMEAEQRGELANAYRSEALNVSRESRQRMSELKLESDATRDQLLIHIQELREEAGEEEARWRRREAEWRREMDEADRDHTAREHALRGEIGHMQEKVRLAGDLVALQSDLGEMMINQAPPRAVASNQAEEHEELRARVEELQGSLREREERLSYALAAQQTTEKAYEELCVKYEEQMAEVRGAREGRHVAESDAERAKEALEVANSKAVHIRHLEEALALANKQLEAPDEEVALLRDAIGQSQSDLEQARQEAGQARSQLRAVNESLQETSRLLEDTNKQRRQVSEERDALKAQLVSERAAVAVEMEKLECAQQHRAEDEARTLEDTQSRLVKAEEDRDKEREARQVSEQRLQMSLAESMRKGEETKKALELELATQKRLLEETIEKAEAERTRLTKQVTEKQSKIESLVAGGAIAAAAAYASEVAELQGEVLVLEQKLMEARRDKEEAVMAQEALRNQLKEAKDAHEKLVKESTEFHVGLAADAKRREFESQQQLIFALQQAEKQSKDDAQAMYKEGAVRGSLESAELLREVQARHDRQLRELKGQNSELQSQLRAERWNGSEIARSLQDAILREESSAEKAERMRNLAEDARNQESLERDARLKSDIQRQEMHRHMHELVRSSLPTLPVHSSANVPSAFSPTPLGTTAAAPHTPVSTSSSSSAIKRGITPGLSSPQFYSPTSTPGCTPEKGLNTIPPHQDMIQTQGESAMKDVAVSLEDWDTQAKSGSNNRSHTRSSFHTREHSEGQPRLHHHDGAPSGNKAFLSASGNESRNRETAPHANTDANTAATIASSVHFPQVFHGNENLPSPNLGNPFGNIQGEGAGKEDKDGEGGEGGGGGGSPYIKFTPVGATRNLQGRGVGRYSVAAQSLEFGRSDGRHELSGNQNQWMRASYSTPERTNVDSTETRSPDLTFHSPLPQSRLEDSANNARKSAVMDTDMDSDLSLKEFVPESVGQQDWMDVKTPIGVGFASYSDDSAVKAADRPESKELDFGTSYKANEFEDTLSAATFWKSSSFSGSGAHNSNSHPPPPPQAMAGVNDFSSRLERASLDNRTPEKILGRSGGGGGGGLMTPTPEEQEVELNSGPVSGGPLRRERSRSFAASPTPDPLLSEEEREEARRKVTMALNIPELGWPMCLTGIDDSPPAASQPEVSAEEVPMLKSRQALWRVLRDALVETATSDLVADQQGEAADDFIRHSVQGLSPTSMAAMVQDVKASLFARNGTQSRLLETGKTQSQSQTPPASFPSRSDVELEFAFVRQRGRQEEGTGTTLQERKWFQLLNQLESEGGASGMSPTTSSLSAM